MIQKSATNSPSGSPGQSDRPLHKVQSKLLENSFRKVSTPSRSSPTAIAGREASSSQNNSPKIVPYKNVRTDHKDQRIQQYIKQKCEAKPRRELNLESLRNLRAEVYRTFDESLLDIITNSTYVGCVDEKYALIQNDLDLRLINVQNLNQELFYQIVLVDFANFDYIELQEPLSLAQLLSTYFLVNAPTTNIRELVQRMVAELVSNELRMTMLDDYFSLRIDPEDGTIEALPCLAEGHFPCLAYLPDFVYCLCTKVNWEEEEPCFHELSTELARFYCRAPMNLSTEEEHTSWSLLLSETIYPLYKSLLCPSKNLTNLATFHNIANMNDLYRVFERC